MKETRQQIIENTRRKIARQYSEQIKSLKEKNDSFWKDILEYHKKIGELQNENSRLEQKIQEQQEWIDRLIQFVNLPPDQRERELALFRQKQANEEAYKRLFDSPLFKMYEKYLHF